MINLDSIQNQAVDRAMAIVRQGGAFKLLGKAGTGKTTTGLAIVGSILDAGYKVICCAFTNKAVIRMKEVGYPPQHCRTLHRLLYKTGIQIQVGDYLFSEKQADKILRSNIYDEEGADVIKGILDKIQVPEDQQEFVYGQIKKGRGDRVSGYVLKTEEELAKEGITRETVIVVDELSMVPIDAADELHGIFKSVIYIGDPGQLPPVNSVDTCKYLSADDTVELKTVHRVQGNDHLLDLIYELDAGKIPAGVSAIDIGTFHHMAKDNYQFICYTNNGVAWLNEEIRRVLGLHGSMPETGEPLITVTRTRAERIVLITDENREWFLKNQSRLQGQYKHSRGQSGAVYNYESSDPKNYARSLVSVTLCRMFQKNEILLSAGRPQKTGSELCIMPVTVKDDPEHRIWTVKTMPFWAMKQGRKRAFRNVGRSMTLDFAYAITAHKAQGSEWPKVAVMLRQVYRKDMGNEELIDEVKRWNYTAGTRGREDIQLFTSIIGCPYG